MELQGVRTVRLRVNLPQYLLLHWVVGGFAQVARKVVFIPVALRR